MITTGIFARNAASTGAISACRSNGASTIPGARRTVKFSTTEICWSRSSSRSGPFQFTFTFTLPVESSRSALRAPAWIDFQNSWLVPLGITAMLYVAACKDAETNRARQKHFIFEFEQKIAKERKEKDFTSRASHPLNTPNHAKQFFPSFLASLACLADTFWFAVRGHSLCVPLRTSVSKGIAWPAIESSLFLLLILLMLLLHLRGSTPRPSPFFVKSAKTSRLDVQY